MDVLMREYLGEIMGICTASNRTTDSSVLERRRLPLSLFDTSIQLCSSVHLRVRCKADPAFFTEGNNLYIGCREERRRCARTVADSYFTQSQTVRTYKMMSDVGEMLSFAKLKLHCYKPDEKFSRRDLCCKVIPSCLSPSSMLFNKWIWLPNASLSSYSLDRLLPGLSSFGAAYCYPYARFLMACFQHTFRRSAVCTGLSIGLVCSQVSSSDSCRVTEFKPVVGCQPSVGYQSESETKYVNSSLLNDAHDGAAGSFGDDAVNEYKVEQCGDAKHNNTEYCLSESYHITAILPDDDADGDDVDESLNRAKLKANCSSTLPVERQSSADESHVKSSFFIRVSDSECTDCLASEASDEDDDDDDESAYWFSDDDDDDSGWTTTSQCLLVDLNPLKINGLYIPQSSNVPVSPSHSHSVSFGSADEVEFQSVTELKHINDTWQQWYSDDVKIKPSSRHHCHTKHVCEVLF